LRRNGANIWCSADVEPPISSVYRIIVRLVFNEIYATRVEIKTRMESRVVAAISCLPYLDTLRVEAAPSTVDNSKCCQSIGSDVLVKPATSFPILLSSHHLTSLTLIGWELTDFDAGAIRDQTLLREIKFFDCSVPEDVFKVVVGLPKLRSLAFDRCSVRYGSLDFIHGSDSLEELSYTYSDCDVALAKLIGRWKRLRKLELAGPGVGDLFVEQLLGHPNLERLFLHMTRVTRSVVSDTKDFPALQEIRISSNE